MACRNSHYSVGVYIYIYSVSKHPFSAEMKSVFDTGTCNYMLEKRYSICYSNKCNYITLRFTIQNIVITISIYSITINNYCQYQFIHYYQYMLSIYQLLIIFTLNHDISALVCIYQHWFAYIYIYIHVYRNIHTYICMIYMNG